MNDAPKELRQSIARRHHVIGWWGLLAFLTLGIVLETMHGFKVGWYLDSSHRIRRLLFTLAHTHGTLLALINIAFAFGVTTFGTWANRPLRIASFLLIDALVLLPLGFFLGGLDHTETDPGPGVLLVPLGAFCLLGGVALVAWAATRKGP